MRVYQLYVSLKPVSFPVAHIKVLALPFSIFVETALNTPVIVFRSPYRQENEAPPGLLSVRRKRIYTDV